jgi:hypothetical protein
MNAASHPLRILLVWFDFLFSGFFGAHTWIRFSMYIYAIRDIHTSLDLRFIFPLSACIIKILITNSRNPFFIEGALFFPYTFDAARAGCYIRFI